MVVCSATPLINFAAIDRLDILSMSTTCGQVIIPQAVYLETTVTGFPGSSLVREAITAGWLAVRSVSVVGSLS
jgi:predicted nucleic acid-binding protein